MCFISGAMAIWWKTALSPPDALPPLPEVIYQYPDSFALAEEYHKLLAVEHYTIEPNDTLHQVLQRFNLPVECVAEWQKSCQEDCELSDLRPNDELTLHIRREDQQVVKFVYSTIDGSTYTFRKIGDGWKCQKDRIPSITVVETVKGTITDNLYDSCIRAGLPGASILQLADLFAYDIDFVTDLREGDTFAVHFREEVKDGRRVRVDAILAAEMTVDGELYQAFYYKLNDGYEGYFDADGRSLCKLFLKAPLSYSRISSTFTHKRMHPILKIYRPHLGIDYAAPHGAPVSSLGNGTVSYLGRKGGFGNYIEIRHGQGYKTTYGHLAGFAKGLRTGSTVQQGEVIGYVGSSGLATGPHLDFRFYKDNQPINFLKTDFPNARSLEKSQLADFQRQRDGYLAVLRGQGSVRFTQIKNISQAGE
ncbi:M23 family metallopeptidase [Desulfoferrobacter suflitae]|uniref:M23 family metallopeptidase n=1 Tax=Desulfoferrobacter suflitae TaxID=2865782 RepID=UPI002164BB85|nr:peptidoglycan DD-metalloendopeptidase family protein [Desulfoferrobacter suflitae]MCK8602699.1 peptidoglycan DD-metalloendopeptidase family protein [Desulfoferrobacter suflitae]